MLRASTGGMAFGPRGTPHAFQNIGDESGRLLIVTTPSGLEGSSKISQKDCEQVLPVRTCSLRSASLTGSKSSVLL